MKLNNILKSLLNEATTDEIYQKYYSSIDRNIFNEIVKADPKTIVDDNNQITKIGKYAKLLLKLYKFNDRLIEDLPNAQQYLTIVYNRNIPVDIKNINDLSDLYEIVKPYIIRSNLKLDNILPQLQKNQDYKILYEDSKWILFQPLTELGATYLGFNSTWCTSWGPNSLNDENKSKTNRFNQYNEQEPLFIIINKLNNDEKYQIHIPTDQFMLPNNSDLNYDERQELFDKLPQQIKYTIFPEINKNFNFNNPTRHLKKISSFLNDDDIENFKKNNPKNNKPNLQKALIEKDYQFVNDIFEDKFSLNINPYDKKYINVNFSRIDYGDDNTISEFLDYMENLKKTFDEIEYEYIIDFNENSITQKHNTFKPFLENFYSQNKNELDNLFKINDSDGFLNYITFFITDEDLLTKYSKTMSNINLLPVYKDLKENFMYQIEDYLQINYINTMINIDKLINFLDYHHFDNYIYFKDFITDFIEFIGFDYNTYEKLFNNKYKKQPNLNSFNDIFDEILNSLKNTDIFENDNFNCFTNKINKINELFNDTFSFIQNDNYVIYYPEFDFNKNCDNFTYIKIFDKINKKEIKGHMDPNVIFNYIQQDIKESILKNFKRFI